MTELTRRTLLAAGAALLVRPAHATPQGMAEAIRRASSVSPALCRQVAWQRFSLDAMLSRYVALYEALAGVPEPRRLTASA